MPGRALESAPRIDARGSGCAQPRGAICSDTQAGNYSQGTLIMTHYDRVSLPARRAAARHRLGQYQRSLI